jgi:hypothetical protein
MLAILDLLSSRERALFRRLRSPRMIQDFLDTVPINFEHEGETIRSPRAMLREGRAHCIEGALFAAAALWLHGAQPLLLDLKTGRGDDDHVVALFRRHGRWGAISKTNHAVLRYREPVYRTVRELALSYFHEYYLESGRKTLRSYSRPFDLRRFGAAWLTAEKNLWYIGKALDRSPHAPIAPAAAHREQRSVDRIEVAAGDLEEWRPDGKKNEFRISSTYRKRRA